MNVAQRHAQRGGKDLLQAILQMLRHVTGYKGHKGLVFSSKNEVMPKRKHEIAALQDEENTNWEKASRST